MKKCKSCQVEIDSKATKCPHCQTDQRGWFRKHPIITGLAVLFIVIVVLGSGGSKNTNTTSSNTNNQVTSNEAKEVKPTEAPMVVDAKVLVDEFDKNKLAAQDKYTGKVVQATAIIKNISGGDFGDYYLSLEPLNSGQYYFGTTIQCLFKDKNELTPLAKGQSVTVMGTMQDMSIGNVLIKDCSLIE